MAPLEPMSAADAIMPPAPALLALEGRAWLELAALLPAWPLLARAPHGDGHPVLVLPGFMATDLSTRPLRRFLQSRGYRAHGWRLGRNRGPDRATIEGLGRRFADIRDRYEGRKASVVGWSLGGIYARELGRRFATDVRQVITLASPFNDVTATNVARLFRPRSPRDAHVLRAPLPVPTTAFFSRTDGICAWRSCVAESGPQSESVEVQSSHFGMGHHPLVLLAIADRLAQPEGRWRPFVPARWWSIATRSGAFSSD